jgi:hypothetical protein
MLRIHTCVCCLWSIDAGFFFPQPGIVPFVVGKRALRMLNEILNEAESRGGLYLAVDSNFSLLL